RADSIVSLAAARDFRKARATPLFGLNQIQVQSWLRSLDRCVQNLEARVQCCPQNTTVLPPTDSFPARGTCLTFTKSPGLRLRRAASAYLCWQRRRSCYSG